MTSITDSETFLCTLMINVIMNRKEWEIERGFELESLASQRMDLRNLTEKLDLLEAAQAR